MVNIIYIYTIYVSHYIYNTVYIHHPPVKRMLSSDVQKRPSCRTCGPRPGKSPACVGGPRLGWEPVGMGEVMDFQHLLGMIWDTTAVFHGDFCSYFFMEF